MGKNEREFIEFLESSDQDYCSICGDICEEEDLTKVYDGKKVCPVCLARKYKLDEGYSHVGEYVPKEMWIEEDLDDDISRDEDEW